MKNLFILLLTAIIVLTGCQENAKEEPKRSSQESFTFKDDTGQKVQFKEHPTRPVSLMHIGIPDAILSAGVQPVGASSAETVLNQWPAYDISNKKAQDIGNAQEPDIEKIVELEPDVIIGAKGVHDKMKKDLEKIAPVILMDIDDNKKNGVKMVERFGNLFNTQDKVKENIKKYNEKIKENKKVIQQDIPNDKTVLFVDYYQKEFLLFPKDISATNPDGLALKLPENFPKDSDLPLDSEGVLAMNPDYVFFISPTEKDYNNAVKSLNNDPAWKSMKAVKNDNVHYLDISSYAYNGMLTNLHGMEETIKAVEK